MTTPGIDHVGVGVGAIVFDGTRRVFLAQRGPRARNETGTWEFPGGMVSFGETLEEAIKREFDEEYGMKIELTGMLGAFDHILPLEAQHWISITYCANHIGGDPEIREPEKCSAIGWFNLADLPAELSEISKKNVSALTRLDQSP